MKYFRCTANIFADSRGQSSQRNIIEILRQKIFSWLNENVNAEMNKE